MTHTDHHIRGIGKKIRFYDKKEREEGWFTAHLPGPKPVMSKFRHIAQELRLMAHLDMEAPAKSTHDLVDEYEHSELAGWERELLAMMRVDDDPWDQLRERLTNNPFINHGEMRPARDLVLSYTTSSVEHDPEVLDTDQDDDYEEQGHESSWLPTVSWREMAETFGLLPGEWPILSGGGHSFMSESRPKTLTPAGPGAMRVYELAREFGMDSTDMRQILANHGEYTRNAGSMVALPVVERIRKALHRHTLVESGFIEGDEYGCKVYSCTCGMTEQFHSRIYGCRIPNN
jgi:hypothetical protein